MREIQSKEEFSNLLECEMVRADRSGNVFSILIVEVENIQSYKHHAQALAYLLRKRVRVCDFIGWFEENICLLLTDTDKEGAYILVKSLSNESIPKEISVKYKVFTYPSHWFIDSTYKGALPRDREKTSSQYNV